MQQTLTKKKSTALTPTRWVQPLPASWNKAAGLLSHKRPALARHLRAIRREWNKKRT